MSNLLFFDCETYYDNEYSLRKMTTPAYILDPRFELQMVAVKLNNGPHEIIDGPDFPAYLAKLDASQTTTVAFNALFDNNILAWRYGFVPRQMLDAMGMARALLGHELTSFSLKNVADHLELGSKGSALLKTLGKRRAQIISEGLWPEFCAYAQQDNVLCEGIFDRLLPQFPASERRIMDLVLRCAVEPAFECDVEMLRDHLVAVRQAKAELLNACSIDQIKLMSAPKFKLALEQRGVVVEMKAGKNSPIPAFAKTDSFMEELSEHPDIEVQAMAAARLGMRSTIEESRAEKFIEVASVFEAGKPNMPMALGYGRAHTHRLGGEWGLNCMHPNVEVLTPAGWQRVEDWTSNTPIMQWWPDNTLTWDTAASKVGKESEDLIWFDAPFVKGGFTLDHRMIQQRPDGTMFECTAEQISDLSGGDFFVSSGTFNSDPETSFSPDQVRLLVALAADGSHINKHGKRIYRVDGTASRPSAGPSGRWQWGFHKQRKADRLRDLLTATQVPFGEAFDGKRYSFRTYKGTPTWLDKGFGLWCLRLSAEAMDALLDELVYWDGFENSNSEQPTFCTSIEDQAQWVATIAHLRGRPVTIKKYIKSTVYKDNAVQFYVYFRQGLNSSVDSKRHVSRHAYNGPTYCPVVASSYILVRFDNAIHITGNCQNLPADRKKDGKTKLRASLKAPKGHKVIVADLGQIECRLSAWLCGCDTLLEEFRNKKDPYSLLASDIFGRPVNRKLAGDFTEGFIGKTGILGLGYGAGKDKFDTMVQQSARTFEIDLAGKYTREIGDRAVDTYRRRYKEMPAGWRDLNNLLQSAWLNGNTQYYGPGNTITITKGKVIGPNGLELRYADPERVYDNQGGSELRYRYGRFHHKIYGAKFLENIIQFLARIVVFNAALRIAKHGLNFRLQAHDELVYIVPDRAVDDVKLLVHRELIRPPSWAPDLPLTADVGVGNSYMEAK